MLFFKGCPTTLEKNERPQMGLLNSYLFILFFSIRNVI